MERLPWHFPVYDYVIPSARPGLEEETMASN